MSVKPLGKRPNVLVILLDDLGFGQLGCFGGQVDTPHIDRLADHGLRYNRFHVTAICSSSRAALLTGRNHHAVGVGDAIRNALPGAPPGYTGVIPRSAGTLARTLRDNGYSTAAFGKWHLMPPREESPAGPFDRWPLGMGFENFYGFLKAETSQWTPQLVRDNHYLHDPRPYEPGYHLSEDLADRTIGYLRDQRNGAYDRPFFVYFAPGAMHAPHHVDPAWADRFKGRYDDGWETFRARAFERQLADAIVPAGTTLTPRPDWVQAWAELSATERRMHARMQEVFSGFLAHTDEQIGRVIEHLRSSGQLDNTIVMVTSDNGASAEGGRNGSFNENRHYLRRPDTVEANVARLDGWGGPDGYHHYSWGWAWAGNTPFRLWKRYAWLGGTRTPMVVHWPDGIGSQGQVRQQIVHIVDVMPTILSACDIAAPSTIDGVSQQRIDGTSFANTFDQPEAGNPRDVQYFEMRGSRAIIGGEWKATTNHLQSWMEDEERLIPGSRDFDKDHWALFDLSKDFSEANDLSAQHPEKVRELVQLWNTEAERNQVLPLMDGLSVPFFFWEKGMTAPGRTYAEFRPGGSPIRYLSLPRIRGGARISATVDMQSPDDEGILFALGDAQSGYALYVSKRHLHFVLNIGGDLTHVRSDTEISMNVRECAVALHPEASGGTRIRLHFDTRLVGEALCPLGLPLDATQWQIAGTSFSIGRHDALPVHAGYQTPFEWSGKIHKVVIDARPAPASDAREEAASTLHGD